MTLVTSNLVRLPSRRLDSHQGQAEAISSAPTDSASSMRMPADHRANSGKAVFTPAPGAAAPGVLAVAGHLHQLQPRDGGEQVAGRVEDLAVAPQVAGIVIGNGTADLLARLQGPFVHHLFQQFHRAQDLEVLFADVRVLFF